VGFQKLERIGTVFKCLSEDTVKACLVVFQRINGGVISSWFAKDTRKVQKVKTFLKSFQRISSPNINIHILLTMFLLFLMLLVGRIRLKIKTFDHWWSFPLFSQPVSLIKWGIITRRN